MNKFIYIAFISFLLISCRESPKEICENEANMTVKSIEALMKKPFQSEISALSSEIRKTDRNISEIEKNIERGYILHVQTETKRGSKVGICYNEWLNPYYCPVPTRKTETIQTPVPINFTEEKSRLKFFESKLLKLRDELKILKKKRDKEVKKLEPQYTNAKKKVASAIQRCQNL